MCYTFKVIYYVCWCVYVFLEYIFGNIAFVIWDLNTKNCFKLNFKIYLETPVNIDVYEELHAYENFKDYMLDIITVTKYEFVPDDIKITKYKLKNENK